MDPNSKFQEVPVELLEAIICPLDLGDICNLRLTNSNIAEKISRGHFKTYFLSKKIQIDTDDDLKRFVQVTENGRVGNSLQNLTIIGRARKHDTATESSEMHRTAAAELLGEAFTNIKLHSSRKCLTSLALAVEVVDQDGKPSQVESSKEWRHLCQVAAFIFQTTVKALHASALPITTLDIFGDVFRCGLAIDKVSVVLSSGAVQSPERLKDLSINIFNHLFKTGEADAYAPERSEQHTKDLYRFLRQCPSLQHLQRRWFSAICHRHVRRRRGFPAV